MIIIDLNNDGMERQFMPHSFEIIDVDGRRTIKGKLKDVDVATDGRAPIIRVKWNITHKYWELPKIKKIKRPTIKMKK